MAVSVTVVESRKGQTPTLSGRFYATLLAFVGAKSEGQGRGDEKGEVMEDCRFRLMHIRGSFGDGVRCWC